MHSFGVITVLFTLFTIIYASPTKRQQFTQQCGIACFTGTNFNLGTCQQGNFTCICTTPTVLQRIVNCMASQCNEQAAETSLTEMNLRCLQAGVATITGVTTPGVTATPTVTIADISTGTFSSASDTSTPTTTRTSGAMSLTYSSSHAAVLLSLGALAVSALL